MTFHSFNCQRLALDADSHHGASCTGPSTGSSCQLQLVHQIQDHNRKLPQRIGYGIGTDTTKKGCSLQVFIPIFITRP